ncbi:MAG: thiamine phosphate synthase [Verrucomicrobiota bacterium]|nr:thiamine phosphate synthase [Verrucomicrobiota bacterium]
MKRLEDCTLYGILDFGYVAPADALRVGEKMLTGGVEVVQLRAKDASLETIEALGAELLGITEPAGVPLIINDHPQLVPAIGAQGAHVGQEDLAVADARWRAGRSLSGEVPAPTIGQSTHSIAQALAAQEAGADYIGFGPLFPTPTKPGRPAIGLGEIARVHELLRLPIFVIGGIKRENLEAVLDAGARRVVIVSGILQAGDIVSYCREVRARLQDRPKPKS